MKNNIGQFGLFFKKKITVRLFYENQPYNPQNNPTKKKSFRKINFYAVIICINPSKKCIKTII